MMKEPEFESFDQMADATAAGLAQASAQSAFKLFRERRFRQLARLDELSQTEEDRIFNELVIAFLMVIVLLLEAPDLRAPREFREYLKDLKDKLPAAYVKILKDLGVKKKHLREWDKLMAMRYDEYARDRHSVRSAAMQIESESKTLNMKTLSGIQLLLPVQSVAIGCHHHICRSKTDGRDELFLATLKPLGRFYVEIRARLEGGRITPLTRAKVAFKRMLIRKKHP